MKYKLLTAILGGSAISSLSADNLIWSDNFNVPDSGSFDGASLTGRLGGFFPTDMVLRSANAQNQLISQQLRMAGGGARVRFQVPPAGASYNFAAGSAGAQILSGGGIRVEFDYFPTNNTSDNWLSFSTGFPSSNLVGEPGGFRLNDSNTDFGFLLRNTGGTQYFKNGPGTTGLTFPATTTSRHVVINYGFTGLADLDPFTVVVTVDGTEVINQSYAWSNNSGQLLFELGANEGGTLVDNFQIFERTATRLGISLSGTVFRSSFTTGDDIGTLGALLGGLPGSATYALVAGTGATDNAKFQITGDKLEVGTFDFSGANSTEGQQYSVRVRGTSTGAGAQTDEKVLVLTIVKDDDADGLLDAWEIANTTPPGNITDLSGNGVADFDSDGLTDLAEYQISLGTNLTYPGAARPISPILADTDVDGIGDKQELDGTNNPYKNATDPVGAPPSGAPGDPTNPTVADSDADGIKDGEEVIAGVDTFVTNPSRADTDGDKLADGFEVTNVAAGYSPLVDNSLLDTDGDTLTTADEVFYGSSPILVDTDGDTLRDDEEVFPTGSRPATLPFRADSDFDGLSDLVETNTGSFVGANDRGTNPVLQDTDGDGSRDGFEVNRGSDPLLNTSRPALPAGITVVPVTDATSGISSSKTYTHAIAGGEPVTVNGVAFSVLNTTVTPANFTWFIDGVANDFRNQVSNNNNQWAPAGAGVTNPGLIDLFDSFTYSGGGADPGSFQTFTLTGLTPGEQYDVRLYIRVWDKAFSGRPQDLIFTNGAQVVQPFGALLQDRPGIVTATDNADTAYYVSFAYTAEGTELKIDTRVPLGAVANSGSFHFYGLTNEIAGTPVRVTNVARNVLGEVVIDFIGKANTTYKVTKSPDLTTAFGPLTTPLTATTDAGGVGQATVPASEAAESKEFYRIESQ